MEEAGGREEEERSILLDGKISIEKLFHKPDHHPFAV